MSITAAPLRFAAFSLLVVIAAILIRSGPHTPSTTAVEAVIYLGWLALICRHPRVRELAAATPLFYRAMAAGIVACMLVGQFADTPQRTFPFINWTMYSNDTDAEPVFYRLTAYAADGSAGRMPIDELPQWRRRMIETRLIGIGVRVRKPDGGVDPAMRRLFDSAIRTIVKLHADAAPDDPAADIRRVVLTRHVIPIDDYRGPQSITSAIIAEVEP